MAFALKRASLFPESYRRIIIVIPYLSIIEQNAQVYIDLFGRDAVLEHHSGTLQVVENRKGTDHFSPAGEDEGSYKGPFRVEETENWDAPLIVTTSVRFFESLFSNRPSDLRRIHNIARSIVVLDEVQVLPRSLLGALLGMMKEMADDWGCTFVLSTATKPAFERQSDVKDLRWKPGTVREIIPEPNQLSARLRRVEIDWRIRQAVSWPAVAGWMNEHEQALCVVNTREHARKLYDELASLKPPDSLFHLSTRMCAAHRLKTIEKIRVRLRDGSPVHLVSTQLIEAGVDVDFPIAFRAVGPLDSIVQTAGRADREGILTAKQGRPGGKLIVFLPEDHRMPPHEYKEAAAITESMAKQKDIQCDDLEMMAMFFERYYTEGADLGKNFIEHRKWARFATLADEFEMISSRGQDVFVPYGEGKVHIDKLMVIGQLTRELRRQLQRYSVSLRPEEFRAAKGVLWEVRPDVGIWIATGAAYSEIKGLQLSIKPEGLIS